MLIQPLTGNTLKFASNLSIKMKEIKVRKLPWKWTEIGWFWPRVWSRILVPKILNLGWLVRQLCARLPWLLLAPKLSCGTKNLNQSCCLPLAPLQAELALEIGANLLQSFSWNFLLKWSLWKVELKIRNKNFQFGWARMVRIWGRRRLKKIG